MLGLLLGVEQRHAALDHAVARGRRAPTFEASVSTWNIDSPLNTRPVSTPYSPPTSRSPSHTSTLCAPPARCSAVYAAACAR